MTKHAEALEQAVRIMKPYKVAILAFLALAAIYFFLAYDTYSHCPAGGGVWGN